MRRTMQGLRSVARDLDRLEERAKGAELSGKQQTRLLNDALFDRAAAEKFEALHTEGKILPFLWNLYTIQQYGPCHNQHAGDTRCTTCVTHRLPDPDKKEDVTRK